MQIYQVIPSAKRFNDGWFTSTNSKTVVPQVDQDVPIVSNNIDSYSEDDMMSNKSIAAMTSSADFDETRDIHDLWTRLHRKWTLQ